MDIVNLSFALVVILFLFILETVRRGILETNYSIIWIISCVVMGIFSVNNQLLEWVADKLNVHYAPSLLFLFGFLFSLIMIFDLTRKFSKTNNQVITLTQDYALLKQDYNVLKEEVKKMKETEEQVN